MKTWYEQLEFRENPLDLRPCTKLVGLQRQEEEIKNHIQKGEICFLNGLTGSGKSSLLVKLQKDLGDHAFVYVDAQEVAGELFDIESAIKGSRSLFDRISLKEYPSKPAVLIIDEFQASNPNFVLQARAKWENPDEKKIKSIVVAQISTQMKNVTPAFKERLGSRLIALPTLDDSEMKEILKLRLENKGINYYNKLHNEAINLLVACADGNPRRLLEYTDLLFDFHFRKFGEHNPLLTNKTYMVSYYGAKEILELHGINTNAYKYLSPEERQRGLDEFEKKFTLDERRVINSLMSESMTIEDISERLGMTKARVAKAVLSASKKKGIEKASKVGKKQTWQASQHARRLKVNV